MARAMSSAVPSLPRGVRAMRFASRSASRLRCVPSVGTAEGAMAALAPLAGGLMAHALGYPVLFAIAMALQGAALLLLIFRVQEPRRRA